MRISGVANVLGSPDIMTESLSFERDRISMRRAEA